MLGSAVLAPAAGADPDLLGEWHLDQIVPCSSCVATSSTTPDSSGNGNDLGIPGNGAPGELISDGRFANAFHFDGSGTGLPQTTSSRLKPQRLTVLAWVRAAHSPGNVRYVVADGSDSGCTASSYALYTGGAGGLVFYVRSGNASVAVSPDAGAGIWDGSWHAVAGIYDGSTVRLYVDGHEVGGGSVGPASIAYQPDTTFELGDYPQEQVCGAGANLKYLGDLDEVRVYDRALSAYEINYLQTTPGSTPPELPAPPPPPVTLTVTKAGTGTGSVTSQPAGISCGASCSTSYPFGTIVTLVATPTPGSVFGGWSGDCSGAAACSVTMDQARNVTATFYSTAGAGPPPVNTAPPSVSGTARQFETLTGDEGLWENGVTKFTDSWLRCLPDGASCVPIPGAGSTSYTPTVQDVGFTIRFQVIASNAGGDSRPAQSAPTAVVQRGVITAKLTISPNPTCTGVTETFNAASSVSPDGIKSYSFRVIDLWNAAEADAHALGKEFPTERQAEISVAAEALTLQAPDGEENFFTGHDAQWLIDHFSQPEVVTGHPTINTTFDWNRPVIHALGTLARDPAGVVLVVTDYAGHTARAFGVIKFGHHNVWDGELSSDSRANCPNRKIVTAPSTVLRALRYASSQLSARASCQSRVTCVGTITVAALGAGRSCDSCASDAARRQSRVLATAFFNIPPHRKRTVTLALTQLGKRLLHRRGRVRVRVTIVSVSPTGRPRTRVYSEVLTR